ncbi:hypothetical protein SNE40_002511 [Patella caerulea]|uniref:Uncharacterized protein n=1 Tax=Patella caerulea TaxID=87958 RepID=A0AAN8K8R5_PATCE
MLCVMAVGDTVDTETTGPVYPGWFQGKRNQIDMDETFYMIRDLRAVSREMEVHRRDKDVFIHQFAGNGTCPSSKNRASLFDNRLDQVYTKSACPSFLVLNYDKMRIPATLLEVVCNCNNCLNTDGKCRPVYYYRRVLRRTKRHNIYHKKIERIAAACTCILSNDLDANQDMSDY